MADNNDHSTVWWSDVIKKYAKDNKGPTTQIYSSVADLYQRFRPTYPSALIDTAIAESPLLQTPSAAILELGCGPATLTLDLAQRGFAVTAIDPGVDMIDLARRVCADYPQLEFVQTIFAEFQSNKKYQAIAAASSLHWALADQERAALIRKMHNLLEPSGTLLAFWNFPPEPSEQVRSAVAQALDQPSPYYFGRSSLEDHIEHCRSAILQPIEQSGCFTEFVQHDVEETYEMLIDHYVGYLRTLSYIIVMAEEEKKEFLDKVRAAMMAATASTSVTVSRRSIVHISKRID